MKISFILDKLRTSDMDNITCLLQEATLYHVENFLYTNPIGCYRDIARYGIANVNNLLYSTVHVEFSDWLKDNEAMIEFLTEMNLLSEIETVLAETVSFYGVNYFTRVVELLNINDRHRIVGIVRRERNKYSYQVEIITEKNYVPDERRWQNIN